MSASNFLLFLLLKSNNEKTRFYVPILLIKTVLIKLERQLSIQRQRLSKTDKEKENFEELLQEEIKHRNNLHSKLKQSEV